MSYCVNCGVELDSTAEACPLCHTPVYHPRQPIDRESPKPFPTERQEVPLAAKWELAVLISAMLASAAVCCGILNIFLRAGLGACISSGQQRCCGSFWCRRCSGGD